MQLARKRRVAEAADSMKKKTEVTKPSRRVAHQRLVRRSGVIEAFSNVSEIPMKEARRLLRVVNCRGATSRAYLHAVNHCSNATNRSFLETFKTWMDKPALLVALAPNDPSSETAP